MAAPQVNNINASMAETGYMAHLPFRIVHKHGNE